VDRRACLSIQLSVVVSVYVPSHGFILLMCGPSSATLVPPNPQRKPAKANYHRDPNIDSHHFDTIAQLSLKPGSAVFAFPCT